MPKNNTFIFRGKVLARSCFSHYHARHSNTFKSIPHNMVLRNNAILHPFFKGHTCIVARVWTASPRENNHCFYKHQLTLSKSWSSGKPYLKRKKKLVVCLLKLKTARTIATFQRKCPIRYSSDQSDSFMTQRDRHACRGRHNDIRVISVKYSKHPFFFRNFIHNSRAVKYFGSHRISSYRRCRRPSKKTTCFGRWFQAMGVLLVSSAMSRIIRINTSCQYVLLYDWCCWLRV